MKTATITFHSSHNYGSMLQTYAFQQYLFSLGIENEIINLRIPESRKLYPFPSFDIYPSLKKLFHIVDVLERRSKYKKFEAFLSNDLVLTKEEFSSSESIQKLDGQFDCFISGGDQTWNTRCDDWSPAYFLVGIKSKRISYSVSMGATPEKSIDGETSRGKIGEQLRQYSSISVREERSAEVIRMKFGIAPSVHIDPVFLLSTREWCDKLPLSSYRKIPNKYVMVYSPFYSPICDKIGAEIGRHLNMKTITTTLCPLREKLAYRNLRVKQKTGPWEFLWMIRYSDFVLCKSYHAVIFSLIFHKPFFFLDTNNDSRVNHLLGMVGMTDRIITPDNYLSKLPYAFDIKFDHSDQIIDSERIRSREYLMQALGLNDE